jgi:hypothetical protein
MGVSPIDAAGAVDAVLDSTLDWNTAAGQAASCVEYAPLVSPSENGSEQAIDELLDEIAGKIGKEWQMRGSVFA